MYNGCKFSDRLMYASQQQKPAKGFMTSDFHRRCAAIESSLSPLLGTVVPIGIEADSSRVPAHAAAAASALEGTIAYASGTLTWSWW